MTKNSFSSDIVGELRQVSGKLNQTSDAAAKMVAEVETFLNTECSIGVPASVAFAEERSAKTKAIRRYLAYDRLSGKFRIVIASATFFVNEDGDEVREELKPLAWSSAPREYKLASVAVMPELLQAIVSEAMSKVEKTNDAVEAVSDVLSALRADK